MYDTPEKIQEAFRSGKISKEQADNLTLALNPIFKTPGSTTQEPVKYPWESGSLSMGSNDLDWLKNTLGNQTTNASREEYIQQQNALGKDPTTAGEEWDKQQNTQDITFTQPQNMEDLNILQEQGKLSQADYDAWAIQLKNTPTPESGDPTNKSPFPLLSSRGSDLSTEIYSLGRGIGADKGSPGRGMTIASSAGAASMDIARNLLAGIGFEKRNSYVNNWYDQQQQDVNFKVDNQTNDTNKTGMLPWGKFGGVKSFEEGGEQMPEDVSQSEIPAAGPEQQIAVKVAEMLQQGMTAQESLKTLMAQGIPQDQAIQIIEAVLSQMESQGSPQQLPSEEQELPKMKNGGTFKHRVGEPIQFKVNGETKRGVIKKIVDGKIYL